MADTPHPPGTPAPGGHGHGHGEDGKHIAKLWMALSGASAHDYHDEIPGVDPKAARVGHEPDEFNARTIIYVPVAVAIALVITYLIVQGAFAFVNGTASRQEEEARTDDPARAAEVEKENADRGRVKPMNERAERIRTWTPEAPGRATPGEQTGGAKPQPNLEYLQVKDFTRRDANGNLVSDPPFLRSTAPAGTNNSPEIYPEDLRPEAFIDPTTRQKMLAEPSWVVKDKVATVPIDDMIHLVAHDPKWKDVLKVAEKKADKPAGTLGMPKISTGGVDAPRPAAVQKKDDHPHK